MQVLFYKNVKNTKNLSFFFVIASDSTAIQLMHYYTKAKPGSWVPAFDRGDKG